jgi:pyruvate dehydrogenase E2 component (dihydrolipoamide acetyltransferase)
MTDVRLAQLSISMEDGKVLRWVAAHGQRVSQGEVLVEVETDKATIEVEAPAAGTLAIVAPVGSIVPVDGLLAELREDAQTVSDTAQPVSSGEAVSDTARPASRPETARAVADTRTPFASPAARRLAREHGIDLATVPGSGPGGRIVARDLAAAAPAPTQTVPEAYGLRDAVVRTITASWQQIPHVQIGGELAADGIVAARAALPPSSVKVTVTDLIAFALARALAEVPELNGVNGPGGPQLSQAIHLSLAVATSDGVVAPVLRDLGSRPLDGIATERARLVAAAREGRLDRRELAGGTITLSNLGAYPVDFFAPVISGPQIAMVATGRVAEKPVAKSGWIAVRARMWANVAIDHRAADGEAGGRLLAALERQLAALPGGVR